MGKRRFEDITGDKLDAVHGGLSVASLSARLPTPGANPTSPFATSSFAPFDPGPSQIGLLAPPTIVAPPTMVAPPPIAMPTHVGLSATAVAILDGENGALQNRGIATTGGTVALSTMADQLARSSSGGGVVYGGDRDRNGVINAADFLRHQGMSERDAMNVVDSVMDELRARVSQPTAARPAQSAPTNATPTNVLSQLQQLFRGPSGGAQAPRNTSAPAPRAPASGAGSPGSGAQSMFGGGGGTNPGGGFTNPGGGASNTAPSPWNGPGVTNWTPSFLSQSPTGPTNSATSPWNGPGVTNWTPSFMGQSPTGATNPATTPGGMPNIDQYEYPNGSYQAPNNSDVQDYDVSGAQQASYQAPNNSDVQDYDASGAQQASYQAPNNSDVQDYDVSGAQQASYQAPNNSDVQDYDVSGAQYASYQAPNDSDVQDYDVGGSIEANADSYEI